VAKVRAMSRRACKPLGTATQPCRPLVAQRLARAVVAAAAAGREQRLGEAASAGGGQELFPEQASFGLRREHSFVSRLVEVRRAVAICYELLLFVMCCFLVDLFSGLLSNITDGYI
jgi:hypothetical protein